MDHFKRVNDTYGQDIVARWGGEEFLVLLPDTGLEEAMEIAERLRATIENTSVAVSPVPLKITFSGGVANSETNRNVDVLCKVADKALYIAKQTRNRIASQDEIPSIEKDE